MMNYLALAFSLASLAVSIYCPVREPAPAAPSVTGKAAGGGGW